MAGLLQKAWTDVVAPLIKRPNRVQVAAICYRKTPKGKEVLMITSLDSGRWIIPKGWPMDGKDAAGAALQEAWEEAGVQDGQIEQEPVGTYEYEKQFKGGAHVTCETQVFEVKVGKLADDFPEHSERKREWMSPQKAAELVQEPQLQEILRAF